jgi:hypothetical protein
MIKNLTPHPVVIVYTEEDPRPIITIQPKEIPARLSAWTENAGSADGIPMTRTVFGKPINLPDQAFECPACGDIGPHINFNGVTPCCNAQPFMVWLIVSQIVKNALPDREDLLVPAQVVRDGEGNIIGCRSLGR